MIPDRETMKHALAALEREFHKGGWDQEPGLYALFNPSVDDEEVQAVAALSFPVQPQEMAGHDVAGALMYMGGVARSAHMPQVLSAGQQKTFVGMAFVSEGWYRTDCPPEELDGRSFADIPGSREVRTIQAIDTAGRGYLIVRVRGERPTTTVLEKGVDGDGQQTRFAGRTIIGLRDLLYGICRQLPLGSADLDAIAAVGAQGLEDGP